MNTNTKRRPYAAPSAELICLVPNTSVAAEPSWKWNQSNQNDKWGANPWGLNLSALNVSATGIGEWLDGSNVNPDLQ